MARSSVALHYEIVRQKDRHHEHVPAFLKGMVGPERIEVTASLSRLGLHVAYPHQQMELHARFDERVRFLVDHRHKRFLRHDRRPGDGADRTKVHAQPSMHRRDATIPGCGGALRRVELLNGNHLFEVWVAEGLHPDPLATRELWQLLFPGCESSLAKLGVPADVLVRAPDDPGVTASRLRLVRVDRHGAEPHRAPPEGYEDGAGAGRAPRPESPPRPPRATPRESGLDLERSTEHAALTPRRLLTDTTPIADVTWSTSQPALDELAAILDAVGSTVSEFTDDDFVALGGTPGDLGLVLDWWQQVQPHLSPDIIKGIQLVYLIAKVSEGGPLPVFDTAAQQQDYVTNVLGAANPVLALGVWDPHLPGPDGQPLDRLDALAELARRLWDGYGGNEGFGAPRVIDTGLSTIDTNVGPGDVTNFKAYNFSGARVEMADTLVERCAFADGKVQLWVRLKRLYCDFDFTTQPSGNAESWACAIFTFGLCAVAVTGGGTGNLDLHWPLIAFDVAPTHPSTTSRRHPNVTLVASVNRNDSFTNVAFAFRSWNVADDIIVGILNAADALDDDINDGLFKALHTAFGRKNLGFLFRWPEMLHTNVTLPVQFSGSSFTSDHGAVYAALAQPTGLFGAPLSSRVDPSLLDPFGFAFSDRYLASWVTNRVGHYDSRTELDHLDWQRITGIADPDPASFDVTAPPLPDWWGDHHKRSDGVPAVPDPRGQLGGLVENCEPPPSVPPGYRLRTRLDRSAFTVTVPPDGPSTVAGTVRIDYHLVYDAVRVSLASYSRVIAGEQCVDLTEPLDGGDLFAAMVNRNATVADRVATQGLRDGGTVASLAASELAIERARFELAVAGGVRGVGEVGGGVGAGVDDRVAGRAGNGSGPGVPGGFESGGFEPGGRPGDGGFDPGRNGGDPTGAHAPGGVIVDPPSDGGRPRPPGGGGDPGAPDGPFGPGFPPPPSGSDRPSLPTHICEPPHCEWFTGIAEDSLGVLVELNAHVEAPLEIGFQQLISTGQWLPEFVISVPKDAISVTTDRLTFGHTYAGANHDAVEGALEDIVRADAEKRFRRLLEDTDFSDENTVPQATQALVNSAASTLYGIPSALLNVIVWGPPGGGTQTSYEVRNGVVHWPFEARESLTSFIDADT